jgi:uncharacterized protein (DUF885 family)
VTSSLESITPSVALRTLADDYWEKFLAAHPLFATRLGDRRFDDRLDDLSHEGREAWAAELEATLARSATIDPGALGARERSTLEMLLDEVAGRLAALRTNVEDWSLNPIDGIQTWIVDLADYQPVATPDDGRRLVARVAGVGPAVDQLIDRLRLGLARGCVACVAPAERVSREVRALAATPAPAWRLAASGHLPRASWEVGERAAFGDALLAAIRDEVIPAFARYADMLEREILPVARPSDRPGLVQVPGGETAYAALVRAHTGLELDPREVHDLGLREIEEIDGEFSDLGARLLGVHGLAPTLSALRSDPELRFRTAEEVFAAARTTLERAEAAVPGWFGRLPRARCEVVAIPDETAPDQTLGYYEWPALDGSRPGRFYINLHAPETRPRYEAEALAFHEAVPGHHLQLAVAEELEDLPAFQRVLGSDAFAEGWGLYTERLADEMGLYATEMGRFGILSFDAWRAARLVVDTGMHALGWTRDQAIAFMRDHTALDDGNIENEVDRYIAWPGQALAYKIGQLEIVRLRARAEERLGDRFDIRAFHDVVLGSGAVGLTTLARIVDDWVEAAMTPADADGALRT